MRTRPGILAAAIGAMVTLACGGSEGASRVDSPAADSANPLDTAGTATSDAVIEWPTDQTAYQLANLDSLQLTVPTCAGTAVVGADAIGPFVIGRPLSEIANQCPKALPMWDWGDGAVPEPVLLVRLGTPRYELHFADTLPESALTSISTSGTAARTAAGIGPGSPFAETIEAYGTPVLFEGECVLYARFAAAPGLAFRLDAGRALQCGDIPPIVEANDPTQLPASTRVRTIIVTPP